MNVDICLPCSISVLLLTIANFVLMPVNIHVKAQVCKIMAMKYQTCCGV